MSQKKNQPNQPNKNNNKTTPAKNKTAPEPIQTPNTSPNNAPVTPKPSEPEHKTNPKTSTTPELNSPTKSENNSTPSPSAHTPKTEQINKDQPKNIADNPTSQKSNPPNSDKPKAPTPPPTNNNHTTHSNQQNNNGGSNKLSYLAFAIALGALAVSVYNLNTQDDTQQPTATELNQQITTLSNQNEQYNQTLKTLEQRLTQLEHTAQTQPISDESLEQRIHEHLQAQQNEPVSAEQIQAYIDNEINRLNQHNHALTADEVEQKINQALKQFTVESSNPQIDLSEETSKIQQNAQQAVHEINQRAQEIEEQFTQLQTRANPYPVLQLLHLANAAALAGQADGVVQYLEKAQAQFSTFNLEQAPYPSLKAQIQEKISQYKILAEQPAPAKLLEEILENSHTWEFKTTATQATPASEENPSTSNQNMITRAKNALSKTLSKAITVTKADDDGLAWINANWQLQQIIRQNIRLDLAFARNALLFNNTESYKQTAERLQTHISTYFDTTQPSVKQALDTLETLKNSTSSLPTLAELVDAFTQAATQE